VHSIEGLATADLVDAMGRLHRHRCHIIDLVTPTPGRVLFGPAVTISYFPRCSAALDPERYNLARLFDEQAAVGDHARTPVSLQPRELRTAPHGRVGVAVARQDHHLALRLVADGAR
jgi:4-hydroxy-4-methyl-2-oxoglutarate aldolase